MLPRRIGLSGGGDGAGRKKGLRVKSPPPKEDLAESLCFLLILTVPGQES